MPVKAVKTEQGRTLKFGRRRPVAFHPHLHLKKYKLPGVSPPPTLDFSGKAGSVLGQMYLNDQLGDCVIAAMAHTTGLLQAAADSEPTIFSDDEITKLYSAIGGYVPGDESTDQGCDIQTALAYWKVNGAPIASNHKIAGYLGVDASNQQDVMTALWLFENVIYGVELPDRWVSNLPSKSGFTWDLAGRPDPQNGHCFPGIGYNQQGVTISTWGMTGTLTWRAGQRYSVAKSGGELWVVLDEEAIDQAQQKSPDGFDWATLVADFTALGGTPIVPSQSQIDEEFEREAA